MTKKGEIYKCEICGNIVEMLHEGDGELVCCGQPMKLQQEKTQEEGLTEKHLPVVEKSEKGIVVKIGSIPHPMTTEHYIEWIQVVGKDGHILRKFLKPEDSPEAEFGIPFEEVDFVREYCNLHRLWTAKV